MIESQNFVDLIKPYRIISIIGMAKNVGKTTALNYIIKKFWDTEVLGLTSIGRDGELEDIIDSRPKPRIYVKKGSIIATAKQCYFNCDITREIIGKTGISTPMGEIIIVRALSDGYVELGGPSIISYLSEIVIKLKELGCEKILIDGAISRKTFATPLISDATILCTGAALSSNMDLVVKETKHTVNIFNLNKITDEDLLEKLKTSLKSAKVAFIFSDLSFKEFQLKTSLDSAKVIADNLNEKVKYLLIRGVLSDKLINDLIKSTDYIQNLYIIIEDATKVFLSNDTLEKFLKGGGRINVINKINLICIISNPFSPSEGFKFNRYKFLKKLKNQINLPVFDIKRMEEKKNE